MKKVFTLVSLLSLLVVCSAWAGKPLPSDSGAGSLSVGSGSVQMSLKTNPDGSLKNIISGSIPVFPSQVESVLFSSQRLGYYEYSRIKAQLVGAVANLTGLPNNDEGNFFVKLSNGKLYKIDAEKMSINTASPMFYEADRSYFSYGDHAETRMTLSVDAASLATVSVQFGCNLPIGVRDLVTADGLIAINFVAEDGTVYSGQIQQDASGNLSAVVAGIPLVRATEYDNPSATGKLYAVMQGGSLHQFEFNYRLDEQTLVWYGNSWSDSVSIWTEYNELTDAIKINYWVPAGM